MRLIFTFILQLCTAGMLQAQIFSAELTGNPVNTTGWLLASGVTTVNGNEVQLTPPSGGNAGYVYYNTPQNLTICSRFRVSFEFRISNSSSPTADGLAFWYISNPPSAFTPGGGLGLPDYPNGIMLLFDTHDNNSTPDNPIITLRAYDGTRNYVEGNPAGRLGTELTNQSWVTNGSWHKCELEYDNGILSVYLNGSATPSIAAFYPLSLTGYFGFSASTGSQWARHSIREARIEGAPLPPVPGLISPQVYCQYDTVPQLSASGSHVKWYDSRTSVTPLAEAPVPDSDIPGRKVWYVTQGSEDCESEKDSIEVIIHPRPALPAPDYKREYCTGEPFIPFEVAGREITWMDPFSYAGTTTPPEVSTDHPGVFSWYLTETVNGCVSDTDSVVIAVYDAVLSDFSFSVTERCTSDIVSFRNRSEGALRYMWDFEDGNKSAEESPLHTYFSQGVYNVTLISASDKCSDTMVRSVDTRHPVTQLQLRVTADTIIPYGSSLQLLAEGAEFYSWSPAVYLDRTDVPDPVASPVHPETFEVVGTDSEGCRGTAQVKVDIDYTMTEMVPDAFTPNGDGLNDLFRLVNITYQKIADFRVYNRWGEEVFMTTDPNQGWDGTWKGVPQNSGTYHYFVNLIYPDGRKKSVRGNVILIR